MMIDAAGLVGREGERNSSMLSITGPAAEAGPLAPGQRWSLARKHEVVLRLLRGEPVEAVSRQLGVPVWQLERWRARALAGLKTGLRERRIPPSASWPRPIGGSVSSPWRSSCSAPASSAPALWPAGGRADGRRELPGYRRGLRRAAGLRHLGHAAL